MYPPIYDETDEWGDLVHRVVFRNDQIIELGGPQTLEEAHELVRELLRRGLRDGHYDESDFYPQNPNDMYMQRLPSYYVAMGGRGLEEEQGNAAHGHGCGGGSWVCRRPASRRPAASSG